MLVFQRIESPLYWTTKTMNEMMHEETKQQLGEDMNILDKGGSMNHAQKKVWQ